MKTAAILEIGVEDLPAGMVRSALEQIQKLSMSLLKNYRIEFENLSSWGSSRRLVLYIEGISPVQKDAVEKEIGPPKNVIYDSQGNLTVAGERYLKAKKISEKDLGIQTLEKGDYVYIKRYTRGEKTINVLPVLFQELIRSIRFSRSMRWGEANFYFGRPLRYILSILGKEVVEFEIGKVKSGRKTRGHRYLCPDWIEVPDVESYRELLRRAKVILDPEERKAKITRQIKKVISELQAKGYKAQPVKDEELLDELSYLVEYPTVFCGEFDSRYLSLPFFILEACLRDYQKHFTVSDGKKVLPFFIGVRDGTRYNLQEIVEGNRRVLHARLNDAQFFYQEDKKIPLEKRVPDLKGVIVQEKLGSYYEKTKRLVKLSEKICSELKIQKEIKERVKRAAYLCKADLLTTTAKEFPELQGILGKEYALCSGEDPLVARAIEEHKKPRFPGDTLPQSLEGAILSIVDKIDTLSGAFWAGFIPSGSEDPWGLRRDAQGLVEIILDKKINIQLMWLINESMALYGNRRYDAKKKLGEFLEGRITTLLRDEGVSHDRINAVMRVDKDNLVDLFARARALNRLSRQKEFDQELMAIVRLINILKQAKDWGIKIPSKVSEEKLNEKEEINLYNKWRKIKEPVDRLLYKKEYLKAYKKLSLLKEPIHTFFDKVLVMSKDYQIRLNRLSLLSDIASRFLKIADFTQLTPK